MSEVINLHEAKLAKMRKELAEEIRITLKWCDEMDKKLGRERASNEN